MSLKSQQNDKWEGERAFITHNPGGSALIAAIAIIFLTYFARYTYETYEDIKIENVHLHALEADLAKIKPHEFVVMKEDGRFCEFLSRRPNGWGGSWVSLKCEGSRQVEKMLPFDLFVIADHVIAASHPDYEYARNRIKVH